MDLNDLQEEHQPARFLIKQPKALQWFHHDTLCKESDEERQAGRFELFLDLLYVALVANFADDLSEHADPAHLVKYILIFAPAWHIWSDLREIMNSYFTDDLIQRLSILWVMALMVLYANNAPLVDEDAGALRTTVGAYMTARFSVGCVFVICSFASYQHRLQARILAGFMSVGILMCVPLFSDHVSLADKCALVAVIVVFQECTWAITLSPWLKRRLKLEYSTALDMAHEIDRLAAFFIVILGEFLYSIIVGSPAAGGLNQGFIKAVCTLAIAFCLNWLYTSGDGSVHFTHPIRRSPWTAFAWFLLHLPMSAAFLVGGHICAISTRVEEFESGEKWLLAGGLGVGMLFLWVYGAIHLCEDDGELLSSKHVRIGMRLVVAVLLGLLPVVGHDLDTLDFMLAVTFFVALVTLWETVGGLTKGAKIWQTWEDRHPPGREIYLE